MLNFLVSGGFLYPRTPAESINRIWVCSCDQGYGRGGTPVFTGVFEPLARRVALYLTDENGLGTFFGAD